MQRKLPARRAFHGLAGRYDPADAVAAPTPSPVIGPEPVVSVKGIRPVRSATGGLSALASQVYRPRRDPTTGKVVEVEPDAAGTQIETLRASWRTALRSAGIDLREIKCVHGHMYSEHYCEVCRLSPIDPDYNPDVYRAEIGKALKKANRSLRDEEGRRDLNQIVDIELWKAGKKYGEGMNEKLAYEIANNQAKRFIKNRIAEQMVESTDPAGNVILISRFESMDDKPVDDNGNEMESPVEIAAALSPAQSTDYTPIQIERLQTLVATWHGSKRLVGEAMLRPNFSVRTVPGVSKSTAARIRQVVVKEFKSLVIKGLTK